MKILKKKRSERNTVQLVDCCVTAAPRLLEELKNVRVIATERVTLNCRIDRGAPVGSVKWYRNSHCCKIFKKIDDERCEITADDDTMSLIIAESQASDSATYRCEVVNKFGKVRTECIVVVLRTYVSLSTFH